MKTIEEMIAYMTAKNYSISTPWLQKHITVAYNQLAPNEDVKLCFCGFYNIKSVTDVGLGTISVYLITNKRLIIANKKILGEFLKIINLDNINDFHKNKALAWGYINIDTFKENINIMVYKAIVDDLFNDLSTVITFNKNKSIQHGNFSTADELLKYKQLLDIGVISQEEFFNKKNELLEIKQ